MSSNSSSKSFEETLEFLKTYVEPVKDTRLVPLSESLSYFLAEDIICPINIPAFDNSAMDGWAFSSKDILPEGFTLKEVGSSFAGHPFLGELKTGECVRIMTGGKVPEGADTVVMQEQVTAHAKEIAFPSGVKKGQNVRKKAEEFAKGAVCMEKGTRIMPPHINFLATLGIPEGLVFRKVRVAFFSTGDELQSLGSPLKDGHIYDSNRYAIRALLESAGFETKDLGIVKDNPESLKETFQKAADCADAVITSGGVSVGKADFTRTVVEELGELVQWQCRIKPGRPLAIGKIGESYFFGLPGNPTATQITFLVIVKQALQLLANAKDVSMQYAEAEATEKMKKREGHTEFLRGILYTENGKAKVRSAGSQKTGASASMITANCLIYLPEDHGPVQPGETLLVVPFQGVYQ